MRAVSTTEGMDLRGMLYCSLAYSDCDFWFFVLLRDGPWLQWSDPQCPWPPLQICSCLSQSLVTQFKFGIKYQPFCGSFAGKRADACGPCVRRRRVGAGGPALSAGTVGLCPASHGPAEPHVPGSCSRPFLRAAVFFGLWGARAGPRPWRGQPGREGDRNVAVTAQPRGCRLLSLRKHLPSLSLPSLLCGLSRDKTGEEDINRVNGF